MINFEPFKATDAFTMQNFNEKLGGVINQVNSEIQRVKDSGVKIEVGQFSSKGFGQSNPTSITFSFVPKTVILASDTTPIVLINPMTKGASSAGKDSSKTTNYEALTVEWNEKTVSWYVADGTYQGALKQMNSGYYIAFG